MTFTDIMLLVVLLTAVFGIVFFALIKKDQKGACRNCPYCKDCPSRQSARSAEQECKQSEKENTKRPNLENPTCEKDKQASKENKQ